MAGGSEMGVRGGVPREWLEESRFLAVLLFYAVSQPFQIPGFPAMSGKRKSSAWQNRRRRKGGSRGSPLGYYVPKIKFFFFA